MEVTICLTKIKFNVFDEKKATAKSATVPAPTLTWPFLEMPPQPLIPSIVVGTKPMVWVQ